MLLGYILIISSSLVTQLGNDNSEYKTEIETNYYFDKFLSPESRTRKRPGYNVPIFEPPSRFPNDKEPALVFEEFINLLSKITDKDVVTEFFTNIKSLSPQNDLILGPVAVRRSASLQRANDEFPRVIPFSKDGSSMFSFNGSPQQRGYHELEAAFLRNGAYEFYSVNEAGRISEANPVQCQNCHGITGSMKPLWDPKDLWVRSFGSTSFPSDDNEEFEAFVTFVHGLSSHPRYSIFSYEPFFITEASTPGWIPNQSLTIAIRHRLFEMMSEAIHSHPHYFDFSPAIEAALARCPNIDHFFPQAHQNGRDYKTLRDETLEMIEEEISSKSQVIRHMAGYDDVDFQPYIPESFDLDITTRLRFVLEKMGIELARWSLSSSPISYLFDNFYDFYEIYFEGEKGSQVLTRGFGYPDKASSYCDNLWKQSNERLSSIPPIAPPEIRLEFNQIVATYCASCHTDSQSAPLIDFTAENFDASFVRRAIKRISPEAPVHRRMPLYQAPMPNFVREIFIEELQNRTSK